MSAAKKWAGPEQAASGLLISYLEKNVLSAKSFLVGTHSMVAGDHVLEPYLAFSHTKSLVIGHLPCSPAAWRDLPLLH